MIPFATSAGNHDLGLEAFAQKSRNYFTEHFFTFFKGYDLAMKNNVEYQAFLLPFADTTILSLNSGYLSGWKDQELHDLWF